MWASKPARWVSLLRFSKLAVPLILCALASGADSRLADERKRQALAEASRLPTDARIALLEGLIKAEPKDRQVQLELAGGFIQKLRETGDAGYLSRASSIVNAVLEDRPPLPKALRLRNEVEMNLHHFAKVADYAEAMLASDPSDAPTVGVLGDALMELGDYNRAHETYKRMVSLGANLFSYNRLAYYEFVTGNPDAALSWMNEAIAAGSSAPENVAWCYSEMGDMLFKLGRVGDAEQAYRSSLIAFPGYHRAHAGLGRTSAAHGDVKTAIANFLKAQIVVPLPEYAGWLETLYGVSSDLKGAARQRAVLDATEKLMSVNGEKANRTLALIYADASRNIPHAVDLARAEFDVRNDVYSWDALSWVLYKNTKLAEAANASDKALAQHTPEPGFFFHAGMIAEANGDQAKARTLLAKALALNANFDPRNAPIAKTTHDKLASK